MGHPTEIIQVEHHDVACDGGGGSLGHPKVYLHITDQKGEIDCPYCGRKFIYKAAKAKKSAH